MDALSPSHLPAFALYWIFVGGSVSAGTSSKLEESPWLQTDAVESVVEELIHHFKADAPSRKSQFTERLVKRIYAYQDDLRPIYDSLPKNEKGHLEMAEVGQALHRLFVRRYQMHLRGMTSFGDSTGGAAPATKVEEFVQKAIQSGLVDKGFTNRELSIFAVAIEHLIHEETRGILGKVFTVLSLPQGTAVPQEKAREALDAYVVFLLGRQDTSAAYDISMEALAKDQQRLEKEQSSFLSSCQQQLRMRLASQVDAAVTFDAVLLIAEEFEQGLGATYQQAICEARKKVVLSAGTMCDDTGRIPFSALQSNSFVGSFEALNRQGILETSSGPEQMAYYSNWMLSADNCQIKTDFYTICCADPCETILSKIERQIKAPVLKEEHLESVTPLLNGARSKTQDELRSYLMKLVGDSGSVDIHGTDFAQFLHYSIPCECPHVPDGPSHPLPSSTTLAVQEQPAIELQQLKQHQELLHQLSALQSEQQQSVNEEAAANRSFWRYASFGSILLVLAFGFYRVALQQKAFHEKYGKLKTRKGGCVDYTCDMKGMV